MTTGTRQRTFTIKEAAALTGLPATTLRFYEQIGVIPPVSRGSTSGHRVYDEDDLDRLMGIACLAATGMSVAGMRQYVDNGRLGAAAAADQVRLLSDQADHLAQEAEQLALRQRYVQIKIAYWRAVEAGDRAEADRLSVEAGALVGALSQTRNS